MVDAIADGAPVAAIEDRMHELENRRVELVEILKDVEPDSVFFHPNIADRYHKEVQNLVGALNDPEHRAEAAEIVRSLIDKIVITPHQDEKRLVVDLVGDLAGILSIAANSDKGLVSSQLSDFNPDKQEAMVAGGRNQLSLLVIALDFSAWRYAT